MKKNIIVLICTAIIIGVTAYGFYHLKESSVSDNIKTIDTAANTGNKEDTGDSQDNQGKEASKEETTRGDITEGEEASRDDISRKDETSGNKITGRNELSKNKITSEEDLKSQDTDYTPPVREAQSKQSSSRSGAAGTSGETYSEGSGRPARWDGKEWDIDLYGKVEFSSKDVYGDAVDSSIFKDYKLTMINVWGTLCKPCIKEMPDIQKLYEEIKDENVNVIGFIANSEADRQEKAKEILKAKGISYTNVLFNDDLSDQISGQTPGYPTTIFVDSEGNVIGEQVCGSKSVEEYKKEIEKRLKELDK